MSDTAFSEVTRLENLWGGQFGDEYVTRNIEAQNGREPFWGNLINNYNIKNVLEVGCNVGANIHWIAKHLPKKNIFGVDINQKALDILKKTIPGVNTLWSPARELPFRDKWFDLVFTTGVLIHQTPKVLPVIMNEIVRCSKKYILCAEYYAESLTEVPYRNQNGALFKQDFGKNYQDLFPELTLLQKGFLKKENGGWDDVTFWLFQKI